MLLVPLSFFAACEMLVFSYNMTLFSWLSNPPHWTTLPDVAPTAWLGVVAPCVTACASLWWGLRWLWRRQRQAISVDDAGITIKKGGRRPVRVPFASIRIFLRISYGGNSTAGSYHLAGQRRAVTFTILRAGNAAIAAEERATYADRARRLLATIAARSGVTMRLPYFLALRLQAVDALHWQRTRKPVGYSKELPATYQPAYTYRPQRIRRTGSIREAWGWFFAGIVSAAPQVTLLVAIQDGWMGAKPDQGWYAVFVPSLAVSAILLLGALAPLVRGGRLRAAVRQKTRVLRYAMPVPDLAQALATGETLTMERFGQPISVIFGYCIFIVLPLFLFFALIVPVNDPSLYTVSQPMWLWLVLALPFLDGAGLTILIALAMLAARRQHIQADDQGITIQRTLRRTRHISWDAIKSLYRPMPTEQSIIRIIENGRSTRLALGSAGLFKGGFNAYYENMQRLLATIIIRSHVPLMAMPLNHFMTTNTNPRRTDLDLLGLMSASESVPDHLPSRTVPTALALDEVVPVRNQPPRDAIALAAAQTLPFVLRRRLGWRFLFGISASLLMIGCVAALMTLLTHGSQQQARYNIVYVLILDLLYLPIFVMSDLTIAIRATIIADEHGIRRRRILRRANAIAWQDIEQWIVLWRDQRGGVIYALIGHGRRLTWREPADIELGRQRATYRSRAKEMHALIAQRTRLKLSAAAR
jgi:hypothetical protein